MSVYPFRASCGHVIEGQDGIGCGYSLREEPNGERTTHCYPCSDALQCEALTLPGTVAFVAYVDADDRGVSTWTGGQLARVVGAPKLVYNTFAGTYLKAYRLQTPDGRFWHGRGLGEGCALTFRVSKWRPQG